MQEISSKQEEKKIKEKTIEDTHQKKTSETINIEKSIDTVDKKDVSELLKQTPVETRERLTPTVIGRINEPIIEAEKSANKEIAPSDKYSTLKEQIRETKKNEIIIPTIQELYKKTQKLQELYIPTLNHTEQDLSINNLLDNTIPQIIQKERITLQAIDFGISHYPTVRLNEHLDKQYSLVIVTELSKGVSNLEKSTEFLAEAKKGDKQEKFIEDRIAGEKEEGLGEENLFTELFEWDSDPIAFDKFQSGISSKEPLCVFLVAKGDKIIAENTIVKLLSTEFKRKHGTIDATHQIGDLSNRDKTIVTFDQEHVDRLIEVLKIRKSDIHHSKEKSGKDEYNEFVRQLDDLMKQIDFTRGAEKKLLIFKCNSGSNIDRLYNEVRNKITRTCILKSINSSLSKDNLKKIVKHLCWLLSIPSYKQQSVVSDDLDSIFTNLDDVRQYYWDELPHDRDWIKIKKSWGDEDTEHLKLKLLSYKQLKKSGYKETEIKIEELFENGKEKSIPDLEVIGNIWVEVETLLGSAGPSFLIPEKFQNKKNGIMQHKEFWLILPNFEIFMHRKDVKSLLTQLYDLFNKQVKVKIFGSDIISRDLELYRSKG